MSQDLRDKYRSTPLYGGNAAFIESYYEEFLRNPDSVTDPRWRAYFQGLSEASGQPRDVPHGPIQRSFAHYVQRKGNGGLAAPGTVERGGMAAAAAQQQAAVLRLINAYRVRGHEVAQLDPLGLWQRPPVPDLDPGFHGLGESDMDTVFNTGSLFAEERLPLRRILELVRTVYTGTIGSEYMHIVDTRRKRWIQQRLEASLARLQLSAEDRRHVLMQLTAAEGIEKYLHTRYVGQKRFSLEGGDALIPQLDDLIRHAGRRGVDEVVIGMAHRGRLNVLVNILGKSPRELFEEFEGKHDLSDPFYSGDVKYHMGFSSDVGVDDRLVHLVLAFNPSHLEIVNPVVLGSVRSRQDRRSDGAGDRVLPVLIHGDASFAGQGVVMEVFNMSQTRGYRVGGSVHIVINNQVGFTTSNPEDARSTMYCTDVAKMVQAPIFHVNADDPEAVLFVTRLALEYRMEFHEDVVIDLVCYRRQGHNEADEPAVTQPLMYQRIKQRPTCRALYADHLARGGVLAPPDADAVVEAYRDGLDEGRNIVREWAGMIGNQFTVKWDDFRRGDWDQAVDTALPKARVQRIAEAMNRFPDNFRLHPRVERIVDDRRKMAAGALPVDWGFAELLAYGALTEDGYPVRISGQDSGRGTFFHRHAVFHNQQDAAAYVPLAEYGKAPFRVIDSLLSEEAVLGFEYGYATADPRTLVIWEAQFGDFANGAQVVIDQFISSGEAKWRRLCGLAMFLPHGYEGQGPEHSSARLERYLQLCAEHNMQVCVPSTPAQMFHMLRRQMLRPYRKPLIVMTPKSLLRRRSAMSSLDELTQGGFAPVLPETESLARNKVRRLILCSGRVYYDLLETRQERGIDDAALVRVEQLYPFPHAAFEAALATYPRLREVVWCQDEPKNQGAWYYIEHRIRKVLKTNQTLCYAGRPASASTAAGYHDLHVQQQKQLLEAAFGLSTPDAAATAAH
ncbi:MAG: hypothetical protein AMXMBFR76_18680 [Pseudomonadota bacterium]|jgi:2-oxoglutarate dehydrogenase E1 component